MGGAGEMLAGAMQGQLFNPDTTMGKVGNTAWQQSKPYKKLSKAQALPQVYDDWKAERSAISNDPIVGPDANKPGYTDLATRMVGAYGKPPQQPKNWNDLLGYLQSQFGGGL